MCSQLTGSSFHLPSLLRAQLSLLVIAGVTVSAQDTGYALNTETRDSKQTELTDRKSG